VFSQVGAKSRNISYLKGKVPSWVGIPTSVALPFGVFEHVLSDKSNQVLLIIPYFLQVIILHSKLCSSYSVVILPNKSGFLILAVLY
jgi:hypothetical protein